MRKVCFVALLSIVATSLTTTAWAADPFENGVDVICPVAGKPAKADKSGEYMGKTVYFCCPGCMKKFTADNAKFATKANHQLVVTKQAIQVGCPISGGPIKAGTEVEVAGVSVGYCCPKCQKKVNEAGDEEKLELSFANFAKGFTTQTECPVSDKAIDTACSTKHGGKNVYFCCGKCKAAFEANPDDFASKL